VSELVHTIAAGMSEMSTGASAHERLSNYASLATTASPAASKPTPTWHDELAPGRQCVYRTTVAGVPVAMSVLANDTDPTAMRSPLPTSAAVQNGTAAIYDNGRLHSRGRFTELVRLRISSAMQWRTASGRNHHHHPGSTSQNLHQQRVTISRFVRGGLTSSIALWASREPAGRSM